MDTKSNRPAFTVVELLVVISVIVILLSITAPAVLKGRSLARSVFCSSNLRQLGIGFEMYLNEHDREVFPLVYYGQKESGEFGKFWYFGFEPAGSFSKPEGSRTLERELAKLYPYIQQYDSVEICPAFPYRHPRYKPKFTTKWMTYGINWRLSKNLTVPGRGIVNLDYEIESGHSAVLFADTAMVNYWQKPAGPDNPLFEEWHYVSTGEATVHFRHGGKANILYCDGHVGSSIGEPGSFNSRMPELQIGRFSEEVKFK